MAKRDNHYEAAFEAYLREVCLPYVAVDEAKRSRLSDGSLKSLDFIVSRRERGTPAARADARDADEERYDPIDVEDIASGGFVSDDWGCDHLASQGGLAMAEATGVAACPVPAVPEPPAPKHVARWPIAPRAHSWLVDVKGRRFPAGRQKQYWKNWTTRDDLVSMTRWQQLFSRSSAALFVFAYHICGDRSPLPAEQLFRFRGQLYGFVGIELSQYVRWSRPLSSAWRTVSMPSRAFRQTAAPLNRFF